MYKEILKDFRPMVGAVYSMLDEIEALEKELADVRGIANEQVQANTNLNERIQEFKLENHALQMFIEEHVAEDKKDILFKQSEK